MDSCPSESTGLYHYLVQHHQMTAYSKLYPSFLNSQGRQHAELIIFNFCIGYRCGGIVVVAVILYNLLCCGCLYSSLLTACDISKMNTFN